jgi:uncharacterized protein YoaH (UPF0181 family)
MEEKMTSLIGYILEEMRAQENRVETIRNLMYDGYSQGEINDILATAQHMAELQYHHDS